LFHGAYWRCFAGSQRGTVSPVGLSQHVRCCAAFPNQSTGDGWFTIERSTAIKQVQGRSLRDASVRQ
jgi:hypothetical protein